MSSEFLFGVLMLTFGAVAAGFTLYLAARLIEWSKDKPLPGGQNRIVNIAVVSLTAAVAMLLIVDVELIAVLLSTGIKSGLLTLLEEIDLFATAAVVLLIVLVFIMFRRIRKETVTKTSRSEPVNTSCEGSLSDLMALPSRSGLLLFAPKRVRRIITVSHI
jgi:Kef-type K+ transport system membrane component KefB